MQKALLIYIKLSSYASFFYFFYYREHYNSAKSDKKIAFSYYSTLSEESNSLNDNLLAEIDGTPQSYEQEKINNLLDPNFHQVESYNAVQVAKVSKEVQTSFDNVLVILVLFFYLNVAKILYRLMITQKLVITYV